MKKSLSIQLALFSVFTLTACSGGGGGGGSSSTIPAPNSPQAIQAKNDIQGVYEDLNKLNADAIELQKKALSYNTGRKADVADAALLAKAIAGDFPRIVNSLPAVNEILTNGGVSVEHKDSPKYVDDDTQVPNWTDGNTIFSGNEIPATRRKPAEMASQLLKAATFFKSGTNEPVHLTIKAELSALRFELTKIESNLSLILINPSINLSRDWSNFLGKIAELERKVDEVFENSSSESHKLMTAQESNISKYAEEVKAAVAKAKEGAALAEKGKKAEQVRKEARESEQQRLADEKARVTQTEQNKKNAPIYETRVNDAIKGKYYDLMVEYKKAEALFRRIRHISYAAELNSRLWQKIQSSIRAENGAKEINSKTVSLENLKAQEARNAKANTELEQSSAALKRLIAAANALQSERMYVAREYRNSLTKEFERIAILKQGDTPENDPEIDYTPEELAQYSDKFKAADDSAVATVTAALAKGDDWIGWASALLSKGATTNDLDRLPLLNRQLSKALADMRAEDAAVQTAKDEAIDADIQALVDAFMAEQDALAEQAKAASATKQAKDAADARVQSAETNAKKLAAAAEAIFNREVEKDVAKEKDVLIKVLTDARKVRFVERQYELAKEGYAKLNKELSPEFGTVSLKIAVEKELEDKWANRLELKVASKIAMLKMEKSYFFDEVKVDSRYGATYNDLRRTNILTPNKFNDYNMFVNSDGTDRRVGVIFAEAKKIALEQVPSFDQLYAEDVLGNSKDVSFVSDVYSKLAHRPVYTTRPDVAERLKAKREEVDALIKELGPGSCQVSDNPHEVDLDCAITQLKNTKNLKIQEARKKATSEEKRKALEAEEKRKADAEEAERYPDSIGFKKHHHRHRRHKKH